MTQPAPVIERTKTTTVQAVDADNGPGTLPAEKPFVAQFVAARLAGTDFPANASQITPPDRTLRPYDVPMLPYETATKATLQNSASVDQDAANLVKNREHGNGHTF